MGREHVAKLDALLQGGAPRSQKKKKKKKNKSVQPDAAAGVGLPSLRSAQLSPVQQKLVDTIADPSKKNALWNLGGPDEGMSMKQQGELVADVLGKEEAKLLGVPIGLFDGIINGLQWAATTFKSEALEDAAEFGRIGRYYAIEDMLTTDPAEKYGKTTLREHYERIAVEGQEYDPYTSVFGSKKANEEFQKS